MDANDRKLLRGVRRERMIESMRDGLRQRAHRIPAQRGKGSYRRKGKYPGSDT